MARPRSGVQGVLDLLQRSYRNWVEESLRVERNSRDSKWTESIAVGSKGFVAMVKKQLGMRAKGRRIAGSVDECQLRETQSPYSTISGAENSLLSSHNLHYWGTYFSNRRVSVARPRSKRSQRVR